MTGSSADPLVRWRTRRTFRLSVPTIDLDPATLHSGRFPAVGLPAVLDAVLAAQEPTAQVVEPDHCRLVHLDPAESSDVDWPRTEQPAAGQWTGRDRRTDPPTDLVIVRWTRTTRFTAPVPTDDVPTDAFLDAETTAKFRDRLSAWETDRHADGPPRQQLIEYRRIVADHTASTTVDNVAPLPTLTDLAAQANQVLQDEADALTPAGRLLNAMIATLTHQELLP